MLKDTVLQGVQEAGSKKVCLHLKESLVSAELYGVESACRFSLSLQCLSDGIAPLWDDCMRMRRIPMDVVCRNVI